MNELNAVDPTTTWMHVVAIPTAAADSPQTKGTVEADLHSRTLGAQIVASRALALLPADAVGDPSVAFTAYARRAFAHDGGTHRPTHRTAVHRQGTGAHERDARVASSVTPPTGEDRP
jgi:hypothetical protein